MTFFLKAIGLPRITPNTIGSVAASLADVGTVRRDGVAYNRAESVIGAASVAVPVTRPASPIISRAMTNAAGQAINRRRAGWDATQSLMLIYRVEGDVLFTDNPAAPHALSARFWFGPGDVLAIDFAGAVAWFIREI